MKKRIALVGFERDFGPSGGSLASLLKNEVHCPDVDISIVIVLEDSHGMLAQVRALLGEPDLIGVVCIASLQGAAVVQIERVAFNPNDGQDTRSIGRPAYFATLSSRMLLTSLTHLEIPALITEPDELTCANTLFYSLLLHTEQSALPVKCCLLHFPPLPRQINALLASESQYYAWKGRRHHFASLAPALLVEAVQAAVSLAAVEQNSLAPPLPV
jgi:pyrrolidone-carboxylate peptidase